MTVTINPAWRTADVVALCTGMRNERNYEALPILADALQDADCAAAELLDKLRDSTLELWEREMLVALVLSDETAAAVGWLREFTRRINHHDHDGYDEEKGVYINERPSDTDPHDYEYVVLQGRIAAGHAPRNAYGADRQMCWGSDEGADYFRESDDNVREFFTNWSLATGLPGPADLSEVSYRCAC